MLHAWDRRTAAALHLAGAAVNGSTEIYSSDRHLLAAGRSFRVAERRAIIRIPCRVFVGVPNSNVWPHRSCAMFNRHAIGVRAHTDGVGVKLANVSFMPPLGQVRLPLPCFCLTIFFDHHILIQQLRLRESPLRFSWLESKNQYATSPAFLPLSERPDPRRRLQRCHQPRHPQQPRPCHHVVPDDRGTGR